MGLIHDRYEYYEASKLHIEKFRNQVFSEMTVSYTINIDFLNFLKIFLHTKPDNVKTFCSGANFEIIPII